MLRKRIRDINGKEINAATYSITKGIENSIGSAKKTDLFAKTRGFCGISALHGHTLSAARKHSGITADGRWEAERCSGRKEGIPADDLPRTFICRRARQRKRRNHIQKGGKNLMQRSAEAAGQAAGRPARLPERFPKLQKNTLTSNALSVTMNAYITRISRKGVLANGKGRRGSQSV